MHNAPPTLFTISSSNAPSGFWHSLKDKTSNLVSNAVGAISLDNAFEAMDQVSYAMMLIPMPQVRAVGIGLTLAAKTGKKAAAAYRAYRSPAAKVLTQKVQHLLRSGTSAQQISRRTAAAMKNTFQTGRDYVNLASESATNHIIFGEGPLSKLGGHLWPGARNKTPFPANWSWGKIMNEVSDIATDSSARKFQSIRGNEARCVVESIRENVNIRVVLDEFGNNIITAYLVK